MKMMMTVTLTMTCFCIFRLPPMIAWSTSHGHRISLSHSRADFTWAVAAEVLSHCILDLRFVAKASIRIASSSSIAACRADRNRICRPHCRFEPHRLRNKVDIVRGNVLSVVVSSFNIVNFRVLLEHLYQIGFVEATLGGGLVDDKQMHPRIIHFVAVFVVCPSMERVPCDAHFEPSNCNVVDEALHHLLQSFHGCTGIQAVIT